MTTPDPDWWTPSTDDYAATFDETPRPTGPDDAEPEDDDEGRPTLGEELADFDTEIRYTIERGRPGFAADTDDPRE